MLDELKDIVEGSHLIENLKFYKYHGLGNDFVLINDIEAKIPDELKPALSKKLCRREFWIGSDGVLFICDTENPDKFDIKYRMFNPDGSEAEMCGNGIRCFAKHLYNYDIVKKLELKVDTLAGMIVPKLNIVNGKIVDITVDMGKPIFERSKIPINGSDPECINEEIIIDGQPYQFTGVSMGNPHAVIFVDEIDMEEVVRVGPQIERHKMFPAKINVEFVQVLSENESNFAVWERGAGVTLACGTGASAATAAGVRTGKFKSDTDITMHLFGGDLNLKYAEDKIWMTGPAEQSFEGLIKKIYV